LAIKTAFTERFGLQHPIMLAPMDKVAGGRLAAAVSAAGGMGIIGGGYGDADWVEQAFQEAGNQSVGVGFITWSANRNLAIVKRALARNPVALMVSFGDAEELVAMAKDAGVPTIWQIQRLSQAEQAMNAGVDVVVAQGQEGGGHGMDRGLMSLLPAVRDLVGSQTIVLAAGGIADGRGLAASLMLGADGVMLGTRFWASIEAQGSDVAKAAIVDAKGDNTVRSKVFDVLRGVDWPWHYTGRVVRNAVLDKWHESIEDLKKNATTAKAAYDASDADDLSTRVLIAGEAVDLIKSVKSAESIVQEMSLEAEALIGSASAHLIGR